MISATETWKKALGASGGNQPKDADLGKAPFVQLFNLASDPQEKASLAAKHPDIVAELLEIARDAVARGARRPDQTCQTIGRGSGICQGCRSKGEAPAPPPSAEAYLRLRPALGFSLGG